MCFVFSKLKLNDYLVENRSINLSRIIFSLRSKTLDIKTWQPWKYFDNLCVTCELKEESISHFLNCEAYENISQENNWKDVSGNCVQRQYEIAETAQARIKRRNKYIEKYEAVEQCRTVFDCFAFWRKIVLCSKIWHFSMKSIFCY